MDYSNDAGVESWILKYDPRLQKLILTADEALDEVDRYMDLLRRTEEQMLAEEQA